MKKTKNELVAYFTENDFILEYNYPDIYSKKPTEHSVLFEDFKLDKYRTLFYLGFQERHDWYSVSISYLYSISDAFIKELSRTAELETIRENVVAILSDDDIEALKDNVPYTIGVEFVDEDWIKSLCKNLLAVFRDDIKVYGSSVASYFLDKSSDFNIAGKVFFHLVENKSDKQKEQEKYPFAFMATYSGCKDDEVENKQATHTPLKNALEEYKNNEKQLVSLLATVSRASEQSQFILNLVETGELFLPLKFNAEEAYTFLKEVPLYEKCGIMCRVPNWWKKKSSIVKLTVNIGKKKPSRVGLDAIVDFEPTMILEGERITKKDMKAFLKMSEGLVLYKGKWVEINHDKLKEALTAFESVSKLTGDGLTFAEAMRFELTLESSLGRRSVDVPIGVSNGQWLKEVKSMLTDPMKIKPVKTSKTFTASLRKYQNSGYQWLSMMNRLSLGACLADDMGLGKTVQIIALLDYVRSSDNTQNNAHALLVIPASLIGNWENELQKFAPELPYKVLHSSATQISKISDDWQPSDDTFLYITTYAMAVKLEMLKSITWDYLILDEAQAIKNTATKQTQSIKLLQSKMKIAMTGTPIENSLSDLWSLFDFLNPGLLGNVAEFRKFSDGLADDITGYAKLKKIISPFILRRLKTDKSIISDLPDKIEIKEYTMLSKKQVALYEQLVGRIDKELSKNEKKERGKIILSSIMKFKQICNHPDQYLAQTKFTSSNSGKFEALREICETIHEKHESVLVFTQFREMTMPISMLLKSIFGKAGFVLHGGTSVKKRTEMVERFNSKDEYIPYMVLSLKAGGVGLNLTKANHVIHFDRWWNPAVENQATDRAFRIGQNKNVMVYKFITKGTIEEKIDQMIEDKMQLSSDVLAATGEKWITKLSNKELMNIFTLEHTAKK